MLARNATTLVPSANPLAQILVYERTKTSLQNSGGDMLNWTLLALMVVEFAVIYSRVKAWDDEQERAPITPN